MTQLVDPEKIESIVGVKRHARAHFGRMSHTDRILYILHSKLCLEDNEDLRQCKFSLALDRGLDPKKWEGFENLTIPLQVIDDKLVPARMAGQII